MQQDQGGSALVAGFAEEQPVTVDGDVTMMNVGHGGLLTDSGMLNPLCTKAKGPQ